MTSISRALATLALPSALAVGMVFAAPSCGGGAPPSSGCKTNADCPHGTVCNAGKCFISRGAASSGATSDGGGSSSSGQTSTGGSNSSSSGSSSTTSQATGWGGSSGSSTSQATGWGGGSSSNGGNGSSSSSSGSPAPTVDPTGISFAITGDTRPDSPGGSYPTQTIQAIYSDINAISPKPLVVIATGDFQEASDSSLSTEIGHYESAIALFTGGPTYPAMGNHECVSTSITSYCAVGGYTTSAFDAYMQMLTDLHIPNTNGQPYYYETITAPNGDTAKFVQTAAQAWDGTQVSWLNTTLAIPSTFTFVARHEPDDAIGCSDSTANDSTTNSCPFIADVQTAINAAPVPVTLKLEGHTHDIRFDTHNDAIVSGAGGVSLQSPCTSSGTIYCNWGYVLCQELTDKTFLCGAYDWQSGLVMAPGTNGYPAKPMQFIAKNGSPNPGTLAYAK